MYYEHPTIRNGATGGGLTINGEGKLCDENGAPANVTDPARQASLDNFGFKVCAGPKSAKKSTAKKGEGNGKKDEGKKEEGNGGKKDESGGEDKPAPKKAAKKVSKKAAKKR